jgi:hypothetical protein
VTVWCESSTIACVIIDVRRKLPFVYITGQRTTQTTHMPIALLLFHYAHTYCHSKQDHNRCATAGFIRTHACNVSRALSACTALYCKVLQYATTATSSEAWNQREVAQLRCLLVKSWTAGVSQCSLYAHLSQCSICS